MSPHQSPWHHAGVRRRFVTIEEGDVHVRVAESKASGTLPLLMIHASPASSLPLVGLMRELSSGRNVYAPDTLGNGDSAPPAPAVPEIAYYADATARVIDALGLERVDVYGSHTGAHTAVELALARPDRVNRIVLDGIGMFDRDTKEALLAKYAPEVEADMIGGQLAWAWHFVRDQTLFFPYFRRDADHRRPIDMAPPGVLHAITVDVLRALSTYHLAYRAAFRHPDTERLPLLRHRTLVMADDSDPLAAGLDRAFELTPNAERWLGEGSAKAGYEARKAARIAQFLDG
jgi:pimeloyl-ACP methyl ester carboxylesterase